MRPIKLEMQAFGPFVTKQTVDFSKLAEKNGMFLIKGQTGSGKTTIFDAMTFALYGGSSGDDSKKSKVGRNNLAEWRCEQADRSTETFVSFTFESGGNTYRFTRKLVPKRVNLSAEYAAGRIDEDGVFVPFFENPKSDDLDAKAVELIGLTKEQFRQVVLLPQGQFEKFLVASSAEKEEILKKIFDASHWQAYADRFFDSASKVKTALDEEKKRIDNSLIEDGFSSIEELSKHIEQLGTDKTEAETKHKEFDGAARLQVLNADRSIAAEFKALHDLEKKKHDLINEKDEIEAKRASYVKATKAESLRDVLEDFDRADSDLKSRSGALNEAKNALPKLIEEEKTAQENLRSHEASSTVQADSARIGEYETKRIVYKEIDSLKIAYDKAKKASEKAKKECDEAEKSLKDKTEAAKEDLGKYYKAQTEAADFRNRYFAGIYGEIAGDLVDGGKCPVCGSTTHPEPAEKKPDSVSKKDMEDKEAEQERKKKVWEKAEAVRAESDNLFKEKNDILTEIDKELAAAKTAYDSAKVNLLEGIEDLAELDKKIAELTAKIEAFNAGTKKLQDSLTAAQNNIAANKSKIEMAEKELEASGQKFEKAKAALDTGLKENSYEDDAAVRNDLMAGEKRDELHKAIIKYETSCENNKRDLENKQKELDGKVEPDSSKFEERQDEIDSESKNYTADITRIESDIVRLDKKYSDLSEKDKHYRSEIHQAESDLAFARKLRGDSSVGLQRYVLAILFDQVISEANRMLNKVHGGRYHLFRSDDKGEGNKRGLELKVHDNRSVEKEGRSVRMLSGGEKFLVSLALSIGMSTVAQKSGVKIEALFIDEGFGTLDDDSIKDAIEILEIVRKNSGMIGIISHVKVLEENIQPQIEVIKAETGNYIAV